MSASAANNSKHKKSEGGFVHNVKKTVGKITVEVTVDQKYTQSCQQLSKFVQQIKQLKQLVGVYIRQQRALLQASAGVCDHFNLLIQQGGATSEFAPLADNNRRVHQQYLAVAVTDTKKDAGKPAAANAAQVIARKEEKRGPAIAGAGDENKDGAVEFEEEPEVEIGVEGKDIKHVVTKLAEVDGIVAGLRARMKDREQLMSEMDYYRAKVGKLRREYEQQQKLRMEGKIRGIPQKDVDRLERNENHLTISTDRYHTANLALIKDLNFVWTKRFDIFGHIMAEYIRAEKGFYKTGIAVNDEVIASSRARATPWQLLMVLKESADLYPVNLGNVDGTPSSRHEARLNIPLSVARWLLAQAHVGGGMPPSSPPSVSSMSAPSSATASPSPPSAVSAPVSPNGSYSSPASPLGTAAATAAPVTPPMSYPPTHSSSTGGIGGVYDNFHNPWDLPPPTVTPLPPLPQPAFPVSNGVNGVAAPAPAAAAAVSPSSGVGAPVVHLGISGVAGTGSRRASLNPFDDWNSPEGQPHDPFAAPAASPSMVSPLSVSTNNTTAVMTPPGGAHFAATPVARPNGAIPAPAAVTVSPVAPPAVVAPPAPVAAAQEWDPFGGTGQDPWGSTDDPFPSPFAATPAPPPAFPASSFAAPPAPAAAAVTPAAARPAQPPVVANPFDFLASQASPVHQQPQQQQTPAPHNAYNNPFF